ncbi:hypothetical protein KL949_005401, partial [Ogataea haglerorum]
PQLRMPD